MIWWAAAGGIMGTLARYGLGMWKLRQEVGYRIPVGDVDH